MSRPTNHPGYESSSSKGDRLEEQVFYLFKSRNMWAIRTRRGPDNGIDLFGSCMGYSFPVQCKNLSSNVTADHIRAFVGAMSW
ncbi:14839_t:CDS:2 [Dentiscutata erythropus]|uniref:14839_t:CDS:1 n=1 Tax=Dentiscutata erythropus TaxID=1348616 RepID=A0A9N8ZJT6_9GLOM|nr:14839_t:CDS:2 [Dentiscutata erythropus]